MRCRKAYKPTLAGIVSKSWLRGWHRSKGVKARVSRILRASCWMGFVMEIARCKRLFHPTSRSDRSFHEPQKSDREFIPNSDRFSESRRSRAIALFLRQMDAD